MQFTVSINCDNAAFSDYNNTPGLEVATILRKLANEIEFTLCDGAKYVLMDSNGNRVGVATFL